MRLRKDERDHGEPGKVNSLVGPGASFSGDCNVDGTLRVDGEMIGTVRASRMVIIGKTGLVKGDVFVETCIVGGKVHGNIVASQKVELQSGAYVEGDVRTAKLIVEEGTVFNGSCNMGDDIDNTLKLFEGEKLPEEKTTKAK
jgi:cytoskeletal protein CcmA (bactofilin family)